MTKAFAAAGALLLAAAILLLDRRPLLLQSLESRTLTGGAVFNRIAYFPGWSRDTWVMQQSHAGPALPGHDWDRLEITVENGTARFRQADPDARRPLRASCFMCHPNGPRAVRPDLASTLAPLGAWDRARVFVWNLRIKTYGRLRSQAEPEIPGVTPFRHAGPVENEKLAVRTCLKCHQEAGWARGTLTRQNVPAIGFMVRNGLMPPPPFRLDAGEKRELTRFLRGFPLKSGS